MGFLSPFSHGIQLQSPTVYLETFNKQNTRTQSEGSQTSETTRKGSHCTGRL